MTSQHSESLEKARTELNEALGSKKETYFKYMKDWFRGKVNNPNS